ncbi:uncharacterized protein EV422DRAFT_544221 [Fimicolochytrium jonesii]|uniref:uncharacterized protein n=1 Tax=Fimicolochytrium jonesii TaxID=1396493 RepID=UPI0022FE7436|nr:uncharacterized protein EV422DRAFT_544221 [Fimicolochytrium jonesii]KAI8816847.1 hypothetical protein EV422DRAFT_544221 [Fimicolochytrium jonesii]
MDSGTEILFHNPIPVTLKHPGTRSGINTPRGGSHTGSLSIGLGDGYQEKRRSNVTVQVALASKNAGRLKVLELQLTDESDPFFLYHLEIGEDDFHALKDEQNLLVDFQQFPVNFIELLEACDKASRDVQPKFVAQLTSDLDYATFQVIETNNFRNITHISLKFIPGNDDAVKRYLAKLVKELKIENSGVKSKLDVTEISLATRLRDAEALTATLTAELEKMKLNHAEQMSRVQLQHAEDSAREREDLIRQREEQRLAAEREKRNLEIHFEEKNKTLSQDLASITAQHSHVLSHAQSLESTISSFTKQLDTLKRDLTITRQDLDKEIHANTDLSRVKAGLEAEVDSLRGNIAALEREGRDRSREDKRVKEVLDEVNERKSKLEESLEQSRAQNARLEEGLTRAREEINKGNEIIRKLQSDLKSSKSKLKLKNVVTLQQEKLLDEKTAGVQAQQKEIAELKETLASTRRELEEAKGKVGELEGVVEEGRKVIEDNSRVIEWLHKQLNEDALVRPLPATATSTLGTYPPAAAVAAERHTGALDEVEAKPSKPSPTGYRSRYLSTLSTTTHNKDLHHTQPLYADKPTAKTANSYDPARYSPPYTSASTGRQGTAYGSRIPELKTRGVDVGGKEERRAGRSVPVKSNYF